MSHCLILNCWGCLTRCFDRLIVAEIQLACGVEQALGVHQMATSSIRGAAIDNQKELAASVLLSGGACNAVGFMPRFKSELTQELAGLRVEVCVYHTNSEFRLKFDSKLSHHT